MEEIMRNKQIKKIVEVRGWEFVERHGDCLIFRDKNDKIAVKFFKDEFPFVYRNNELQSDTLHDVFDLTKL